MAVSESHRFDQYVACIRLDPSPLDQKAPPCAQGLPRHLPVLLAADGIHPRVMDGLNGRHVAVALFERFDIEVYSEFSAK